MKSDNRFTENQKFNHPVFKAGFILVGFFILRKPMNVFYRPEASQEEMMSALIPAFIFLAVTLLFVITTLKTIIDEKGIAVQFFPFHQKYVLYKWEEIKEVEVRKYNPLKEFGGWGVRFGNGVKAFNTRGNRGLEITFKDGRKRLIGTQQEEKVDQAIREFSGLTFTENSKQI